MEAISSKLQGTLLSVIQAPDALTTGTGADSQEQNRRLQLRVSEVERENSQLIENSARHKRETEQLIGQLDKERVGKPMMENIIVSANAKVRIPNAIAVAKECIGLFRLPSAARG